MKIKEIAFGFWCALWVALDEMSAKEFLKKSGMVALGIFSMAGWCFVFYALYIIGWAVS